MPTKEPTENLMRSRALTAAAAVLLLGLTGCASSSSRSADVETSSRRESTSELTSEFSGGSSELVFSGLYIQAAPGFRPSEQTTLAARNDPRLAPRGQPNSVTRLAYPERGPRSLDQLRVIYLQPTPDRVHYFRDDDRRRQ